MRIFDSEGAWLSASGRDPVFLFFVNIFRTQHIVPPSYGSFRVALAAVFVYFTFRFMSGKILDFQSSHAIFLFLPFLSLILIRSAIQIREGLAVMLLILALKTLLLPKACCMRTKILRMSIAGAFAFLSAGTHLVGSIGFVILLLSIWRIKFANKVSAPVEFVFTPLLATSFFLLVFQFEVVGIGLLLVEGLSGDRYVIEEGASLSEMVVWGIFIVLNFAMWLSSFQPISVRSRQAAVLQTFARNLAGPVAISGGVLVLVLKIMLVSPVVTVLIVRTAEFSSAFAAVLVTILYGKRYSSIVLAAFLLLKSFVQLSAVWF